MPDDDHRERRDDNAGDLEADAAALSASLDQTVAALANLARLVAAYYVALRREGMDDEPATALAANYQMAMLETMDGG